MGASLVFASFCNSLCPHSTQNAEDMKKVLVETSNKESYHHKYVTRSCWDLRFL